MEIHALGRPYHTGSLVTVNIQCSSSCPTCAGRLSPFGVDRAILRRNSKKLKRLLAYHDNDNFTSIYSQIQLQHAGLGFSCRILESILKTWQFGDHERVSTRMKSFTELVELSRALWHYECSPRPFIPFAHDVLRKHYRPHTGRHAADWALIAVVFEMRDVFGYSTMEMVQLGEDDRLPPHPAGLFQIPYEESVPRYIIKPQEYLNHRTLAFDFVRHAYGKLEDNKTTEPIAKRLKDRLTEAGFRVLLPEDEYRNQRFFRENSPAALLRLFEKFLQTSINDAQQRACPRPLFPQSSRFGAAKKRNSDTRGSEGGEMLVLMSHLEELNTWRSMRFGNMLSNIEVMEQRFRSCRAAQLILTSLTQVPVNEMSGNRAVAEAP